jgi:non-heme chloroperoxidase
MERRSKRSTAFGVVWSLLLHGDDDQIVPIGPSAMLSSKQIKNARLTIYEGGSHGICSTEKDRVNEDRLKFIRD